MLTDNVKIESLSIEEQSTVDVAGLTLTVQSMEADGETVPAGIYAQGSSLFTEGRKRFRTGESLSRRSKPGVTCPAETAIFTTFRKPLRMEWYRNGYKCGALELALPYPTLCMGILARHSDKKLCELPQTALKTVDKKVGTALRSISKTVS